MNYYERYCGDYQRDTAHLSLAEHGAYTMLLDTYFSVEKPLPSDLPSLYRVCRAMTRLEQQAVKSVVDQFFPVSPLDGFRHNQRADREIAKARPKIEAARNNGRKGGRPRLVTPPGQVAETPDKPDGFAIGRSNETTDTTFETKANLDGEIARDAGGAVRRKPDGIAHQPQPQLQPHFQLHQESGKGNKSTLDEAIDKAPEHPEVQGSAATAPHHDSNSHDYVFNSSLRQETPGSNLSASAAAGACCKALIQLGVQGCNPHHPTLHALLNAGAAQDEFMQAARYAAARGKASFAYVIGTVKRQREEAAKLVLHRGRMPNRQELLESSNRAASDGWLPPELREAGGRTTATGIDAAVGEGRYGN
jgi:uncharacterized protein YdaU (DUF1376 family)